ncbi:MAG: RecQ family ATP-dependent DNA helicase, partial [Fidelibacterota bacterium]
MKKITFLDCEINPKSNKIIDIGAISSTRFLHSTSAPKLLEFIKEAEFLCGHNIINHDLKTIEKTAKISLFEIHKIIDTLYLSPLFYPTKIYHNLLKNDKLCSDELNNPVNDSKKARQLLHREIAAFEKLPSTLQKIFYDLLKDQAVFQYFFEFIEFKERPKTNINESVHAYFNTKICKNAPVGKIATENPVELAYCLALINCSDKYQITPPWVSVNFPDVEKVMFLLRNNPCITGCEYCDEKINAQKGLMNFFGYDDFRKFDGKALQEAAVNAALQNKSLLAVFPTGGGKSLAFQVPALIAGETVKGLTVIISPLQSLMKDQVDNLEKKHITEAVTINGLLDPIERSEAIDRIYKGKAAILYISPESLRSRTIERLLLGRNVVRFVIDEAHCFSSWGQEFRVDYLYIGEFIKNYQERKNLSYSIPVSCFTATAKQQVIEDICQYFKDTLSLKLEVFTANTARENLVFKVIPQKDEAEKYNKIRNLLDSKKCPTIIYVSRTKRAYTLAERLDKDGYNAKPYHGKMDIQEKTANQEAFMIGDVDIIVATSAFGMGVDKDNVGMVIHYEISDSLENYMQEAGRGGRNPKITADCYVLFDENDLNKHFILLNQTKLSVKEIQQVWRAIKELTRRKRKMSNSALEIARKAGWDDTVHDIETRVKTAIAALEQSGYLKRGQNSPRVYANSILTKSAAEAIAKIQNSTLFTERQKEQARRIISKLFSAKHQKNSIDEEAESRVDYISDHLGIVKEEVITIINLLREENILADNKDLTAYIQHKNKQSMNILHSFAKIENFLLEQLDEQQKIYNIKELNEEAFEQGCRQSSPKNIHTILNFWSVKNWVKRIPEPNSQHYFSIALKDKKSLLLERQRKRHEIAGFIVNYLYHKIDTEDSGKKEILTNFSVKELKTEFQKQAVLVQNSITNKDIEEALFYLSRINALKIEGGFMVIYNKMTIDRKETNNLVQYKNKDYEQLKNFYQNKIEQIHIVGEYAKIMIEDTEKALKFVDDYFQLNYTAFLNKYFPDSRKGEIKRNITPERFKKLFGDLSPIQLKIINDVDTQKIVVAAGPGSGKTRVLVHKLASLYSMEDVKQEQLLMLTFSRAAATEFKKRLLKLIGNAANFIKIMTFHSYCFDLLGKVGNIEKSREIIPQTMEKIQSGEVSPNQITLTVLVIDEAQDMDIHEFKLVKALMKKNDNMRVIAVGDDDQNIYTFRGADSAHFARFIQEKQSAKYELPVNYRSRKNIVDFTNQFVNTIHHRLKTLPIESNTPENGRIEITKYRSNNMIVPLVRAIKSTDLRGSVGVLTFQNDEALHINGLLLHNEIPAKLIQSNENFNLYNLYEIRDFIDDLGIDEFTSIISDDNWNNAKISFHRKHLNSRNYEICKRLIQDFQETNPKIKYRSDFESFIKESKLEDFIEQERDTIQVSTIHKAKGKEFDNVFIMLNNFDIHSDENKRLLYVAMTRAKNNLFIHYNGNFLDRIKVENLTVSKDNKNYSPPDYLLYQLTHKDIQLGYFKYNRHIVNPLYSGQPLHIAEDGLVNDQNKFVVKFSQRFTDRLIQLQKKDYQLSRATINFILYWQDKNNPECKEMRI